MYFWATVVSKFRMMADRCCLGRDLLDTINKYMLLVFLSLGQGMDFLLFNVPAYARALPDIMYEECVES